MQPKSEAVTGHVFQKKQAWIFNPVVIRYLLVGLAVLILVFLATYHLTSYPATWFDEGSHLHVPKMLVQHGVYADFSSEGYRYYGPTVGLGPTVMLPIAAAFELFGIGLAQARAVMVLYLFASIAMFYLLARSLGGQRIALVATALLVTSRGVALIDNGRQVLGEVPGLFFLAAGFLVWFTAWEQPRWAKLILAGVLMGLSAVTKDQYLLILAPTLILAWLLNLFYYKTSPQRVFLVTGIVTALVYFLWNIYLLVFLGPGSASQNFTLLRNAAAGAALVFSPALMQRGIAQLIAPSVFLGLLAPVMVYGFIISLPRNKDSQKWGILFLLAAVDLVWYVLASISWIRYAFPGLVVACLFVARFFYDVTDGFHIDLKAIWASLRSRASASFSMALKGVFMLWLAAMIAIPFAQTTKAVITPTFNAAQAMAVYLDQNVPKNVVIETWEPEMGFLTNHDYHFPPPGLLNTAIGYIWLGKTPPAQEYHYVQDNHPPYVLVGAFASWVQLYPPDYLAAHYHLVTSIGAYQLYQLNP
jgi:hypothetical protein